MNNLHHKNTSQFKNTNFNNSNTNFDKNNLNINNNYNVYDNSDGIVKENLMLNNNINYNINNKKYNTNNFSTENLNNFQQKRIIKNYIANNCNNKNSKNNPKSLSSFSPTSYSNLNWYNSSNQINNTIFNFNNNTNKFQTTSIPNYNQISIQGRNNNKSDLKHLLVFSERVNNLTVLAKNNDVNNTSLINSKKKNFDSQKFSYNINFSDKIDPVNYRVNSESSLANYFSMIDSNKLPIMEVMRHIKYQFSSLDHQKMAMEKLMRSKAKNFCLLISEECSKRKIHVINLFYIILNCNFKE